MSAVECAGVTLSLGGRAVLADVSLAIQDREFVAVLGPNGAGKTTLMRAILGLITPERGTLSVLGAAPRRGNPAIGYLPQHRNLAAHLRMRGRDFVACVVNGHRPGLPFLDAAGRAQVDRALELVGATALARRPLGEISGGERQRLLLAQALVGQPRLLLLDEPLINLDPSHQHAVVELAKAVQAELGIAVLFSAHELNPLLGVIDRVLYLGRGQAALGPVAEVITGPVLSRLYGAAIEVIEVKGRIFVMSGGHDVERDPHQHAHDGHAHDGHAHDGHAHDGHGGHDHAAHGHV